MKLRCIPSLALIAILAQVWIAHVCTGEVQDDFVLMTDRDGIVYRLELPSNNLFPLTVKEGIPTAVAYDPLDRIVYWTDLQNNQIRKVNIDGTNPGVFKQLSAWAFGLAVDPVSGLIFYTDNTFPAIVKLTKDGSSETIITSGLNLPRDIALDPCKKKMYWTAYFPGGKIEAANFDGSERKTLIDTNIETPNGLALDNKGGKMYWTDNNRKRIEGADTDGSNRYTIIHDASSSFNGLTFYDNNLYFTITNDRTQLFSIPAAGGDATPIGPPDFTQLTMVNYHQESLLPQGGGLGFRCASATGTFCNAISNAGCIDDHCRCITAGFHGDLCSTTCTDSCMATDVTDGSIDYGSNTAPYPSGTTATVDCNSGYSISGSATITCNAGSWTTVTCDANDCTATDVTDGSIDYGSNTAPYPSGTTATVDCNPGYSISGSATITCNAGSWTTATCDANACTATDVTDGSIDYGSNTAPYPSGTIATVDCNSGYSVSGSATITCNAGSWTAATCDANGHRWRVLEPHTTTAGRLVTRVQKDFTVGNHVVLVSLHCTKNRGRLIGWLCIVRHCVFNAWNWSI